MQRTPIPDPASSNFKKVRQTAILIRSWLCTQLGELRIYYSFFLRAASQDLFLVE
jgi:hypothetical protein